MRDPGLLADCLVDPGGRASGRAGRRRSGALALSVLIQAAGVAALLIVPIFFPGEIHGRYSYVPLPPFHGGGHAATSQAGPPKPIVDRPRLNPLELLQPPVIPAHPSDARDSGESEGGPPSVGNGGGTGDGPGVDFGTGPSILIPAAPLPKPPEPPAVVRRSELVQEAMLITRIDPVYPPAAIAMHMAGTVQLRAIIGSDGTIRRLDVLSGNAILVRASIDAVRRWRYRPTILDGKPVEVETDITVIFQLTN